MVKLRDVNTRTLFERTVETKLEGINWQEESDSVKLWSLLKNNLQNAADDILGAKTSSTRNQWFDEECKEAIDRKNMARLKALNCNTRNRREMYNAERKKAKKLFRSKKRENFIHKLKIIESERLLQNPRKFYKEIKSAKSEYSPQCKFIRATNGELITDQEGITNRWLEYYTEVFAIGDNARRSELDTVDCEEQISTNQEHPPDIEEVKKAINVLKNNRTPGTDAITGMLKCAGKTTSQILHKIIENIWRNKKELPEEWDIGIINPIPKKGDMTHCNNYRAITLLNTAYKVITYIIRRRLDDIYEKVVGEYQCGFRKGRSTANQLFTMRHLLEKLWEHNITSYHLFIDFKTAYDSIDRKEMREALVELGIPDEVILMCKLVTENSKARVRINNRISDSL